MEGRNTFLYVSVVLLASTVLSSNGDLLRKNVDTLTVSEIDSLQRALYNLRSNTSIISSQDISSYHGEPAMCQTADGRPVACCLHGMPIFLMWHRLYTAQMEQVMKMSGNTIGIPFWDWTKPMKSIPEVVKYPMYIDPNGGKAMRNALYAGFIGHKKTFTARAVDERLFETPANPEMGTRLYQNVLDAFEYTDYCQFVTQFEIIHNAIHYLVGGRFEYSMSSLDYTSYDPIFYLHHSNTDRLFAIWQALQKHRGYPADRYDCDLNLFRKPMEPFSWSNNPIELTKANSVPKDLFHYDQLGYTYSDLTLNGHTVEVLHEIITKRTSVDRAFASFRLSGIKTSANVQVHICKPAATDDEGEDCSHVAGEFFILGSKREMAWAFDRPFYIDISETVKEMGLALDGNYYVKAHVFAINGTHLLDNIIPDPTVAYRPAPGHKDAPMSEVKKSNMVLRKNLNRLTSKETYHLRRAMQRFMMDKSIDGFQALVEFHGLPAKCVSPRDHSKKIACCLHGMPSFPHWHRLFTLQMEHGLRKRGSPIGIPYWDWTKASRQLPALFSEETYVDPYTKEQVSNPFYHAKIEFLSEPIYTTRNPDPELFHQPEFGDHTYLFDGILYAFEQEDFCDFEVQFEIVHNAIHAWIGGNQKYSMSHLHYASFDPVFFLHHSNVDRLWAVWQALQIHRGNNYKAHCAQSMVNTPMKPFSLPSPLNSDPITRQYSVPTSIYDFQAVLGYTYDSLHFGSMSIPELDKYIIERKEFDRVFAGFLLWGIKMSANIHLYIKHGDAHNFMVGRVTVLGGSAEGEYRFDRLFKYDITSAMKTLGITKDDDFSLYVEIFDMEGNKLPSNILPKPTVVYTPAQKMEIHEHSEMRVRKNINQLTNTELNELRNALTAFKNDETATGFQTIAQLSGVPKWCSSSDSEKKHSCRHHGKATFPHWNRLYASQFENGLHKHGYSGGLPYWDWIMPMDNLPEMVTKEEFIDLSNNEVKINPFHSTFVKHVNATTSRNRQPELFKKPAFGHNTILADRMLLAMEQDDFCDFEIQFELVQNLVQAMVGGYNNISMSSLEYSSFDPLFMLHLSNTDRIWAVWQALQKYRGKQHNTISCALDSMHRALAPFSMSSEVNPFATTRDHSWPLDLFEYQEYLKYSYDNLEFLGMTIPQLANELKRRQSHDRIFATFMLHSIGKPALVKFFICKEHKDCKNVNYGGRFYIPGSSDEMKWMFNRPYKLEITSQFKKMGFALSDKLYIRYGTTGISGTALGKVFNDASIIYEPAFSMSKDEKWRETVTVASHVRKELNALTEGESESLRNAFHRLQISGQYEKIAAFHGSPPQCPTEDGKHVYTCCVHGMVIFPQWHRLYVLQVENAMLEQGSGIAIPYWDWSLPMSQLPALINDATYYNSRTGVIDSNPFFQGDISFMNIKTSRDPQSDLFNNKYLYENILLALEQTTFCDFEIQLEVVHNTIHSWLGGRGQYSMNSLDFAAYDPVFFFHHANTDRLWAIWQELQRYRKLAYNEANCAFALMKEPLRPFSNATANSDWMTMKYNKPSDTFDYRNNFHYKYDNLVFNGKTIPQLERLLMKRKSHDRVFAGFLLHGIKRSAMVDIYICLPSGIRDKENCKTKTGSFSLLGGNTEMPWHFDRLYKFEITSTLRELGLTYNSDFRIMTKITGSDGSHIHSNVFPTPTVMVQHSTEKVVDTEKVETADHLVRKDINRLSIFEVNKVMTALQRMKADHSAMVISQLPPSTPFLRCVLTQLLHIATLVASMEWLHSPCGIVYTLYSLNKLCTGLSMGVPYWDWTRPMTKLPTIFTDEDYMNPFTQEHMHNPFHHTEIAFENGVSTERNVDGRLFKQPALGEHTYLFDNMLLALEQHDFCDFEVQFEMAHNLIHAFVAGNTTYSLGHLHYASYDPIFFSHHSNVDRLWAIWQELQTYRGHNGYQSDCALELMKKPLKPFDFGEPYNQNLLTKKFSQPKDVFHYKENLGYTFDSLELNGMTVPVLENYLKRRQEEDRIYAGFLLSSFGTSANVYFEVCTSNHTHCEYGGFFAILGGSAEMPWRFDRLYRIEITNILNMMQLDPEDNFHIEMHIVGINGTVLSSNLIPEPSIIRQHGKDHSDSRRTPNLIRKDINKLETRDMFSLMNALSQMKADKSRRGFQNIVKFHGLPAMCTDTTGRKVACCMHGIPSFLHWHRLFTLQFEQALQRHGSSVAVPYWDWSQPIKGLPHLLTNPNYYDAWTKTVKENPFLRSHIEFEDTYTVRDIQDELFQFGPDATHSIMYDGIMLAFEQDDFCDFSIQLEVIHNAFHYLVGGHQIYAMSGLHYSAYDPIFFIHHSNVDRLWAVWQALQKYRKKPYVHAHCALSKMTQAMTPFNDSNVNSNTVTLNHATPSKVFDYEELHYSYDDLLFDGKNVEMIEEAIQRKQNRDRIFAGFLLHGIETSAQVVFHVCKTPSGSCTRAGFLYILGGSAEMPWAFDRLFKYDITDTVLKSGFKLEDLLDSITFEIKMEIEAVNGTKLPSTLLPAPTLIYVPAKGHSLKVHQKTDLHTKIRKDVDNLTPTEIDNLAKAMTDLQADKSGDGYQDIASFHGMPLRCKDSKGEKIACGYHGTPTFPHWHRLFVKQMEDALSRHGSKVGIPYWDWTTTMTKLPNLVLKDIDGNHNPWSNAVIQSVNISTSRNIRDLLFDHPEYRGEVSFFYRQIMLALEQTNFCNFEIQFEMGHNALHSWVGGNSRYSMSTLEYTAYDPLFYLHHSNADRLWAIWQALQKYRGLPYNNANCEIHAFKKSLMPFDMDINLNNFTKEHSIANDVFDYTHFNYEYDTLSFHGMDIPELDMHLKKQKSKNRVFAGFLLKAIGKSADVTFDVCDNNKNCVFAGTFAILGGEGEMSWAFDRLFKYDITNAIERLRLTPEGDYHFHVYIMSTTGEKLSSDLYPMPSVIFQPATHQ